MPQSPEEEEINPSDKALEHKALRGGVVMQATCLLGDIQLTVQSTPPKDTEKSGSAGKGVFFAANSSTVVDPDRMDENCGGGVDGVERSDEARDSIKDIAGKHSNKIEEFQGVCSCVAFTVE